MQFSKSDIEKWSQSFDMLKYPIGLYDELVWGNKDCPGKLVLLGAWKTGCIRINNKPNQDTVYTDENGNKYEYTNRWSPHTPVGYNIWINISKDEKNLFKIIPNTLNDKKPEILISLEKEKGFGFVWSVFVFHCIHPKVYPLYDQHVYRAYEAIECDKKRLSKVAPVSWNKYLEYARFFKNLVKVSGVDERVMDRALWTYGKYLKIPKEKEKIQKNIIKGATSIFESDDSSNELCLSFTLGGKQKSFWWKLDINGSLTITRQFKTKLSSTTFSKSEIDAIQKYMGNQEVPLANNVQKLSNGTEQNGLGRFIYDDLDKNTTEAQLASHISAIFVASGIWKWNGARRNMRFAKEEDGWRDLLYSYYSACLVSDNDTPLDSVLE